MSRRPARSLRSCVVMAGWTLLIFTWKQYVETPWQLVDQVANALSPRQIEAT